MESLLLFFPFLSFFLSFFLSSRFLFFLSAQVSETLTNKVTVVVFSNGKTSTLDKAKAKKTPVVSLLWVDACVREQTLAPLANFPVDASTHTPQRPNPMTPKTIDESIERRKKRQTNGPKTAALGN